MQFLHIKNNTVQAVLAAVLTFALFLFSFFILEPTIGNAANPTDVVVEATVTAEIAMTVASTSLTLSPSIAGGVTGGIANGSTNIVVTTNNNAGYNLTVQFSSSTAMDRDGGGTGRANIYNYVATSTPDYAFDSGQVYAQFGYSVYSTTDASDIVAKFLSNGSNTCNTGSTAAVDTCWLAPSSTAAETVVNRGSATAASGATSTIQFRVDLPPNPNPIVPTGVYHATATLTAATN